MTQPTPDPKSAREPAPEQAPPSSASKKSRKSAANGNGHKPPNGVENLAEPVVPIAKPTAGFSLDKFKSKHAAAIANVEVLPAALPHHSAAQAKDFARLHSDEENFWSPELCFVEVPIPGMKQAVLHLITEELAVKYLDSGRIKRHRLALASKPFNKFFLCHVPSQNLDNSYNQTNLEGCERAKTNWVSLSSRKDEGVEGYKVTTARDQDAFPDPAWPARTLDELIATAFAGHLIDHDNHAALLRLIGARQSTS